MVANPLADNNHSSSLSSSTTNGTNGDHHTNGSSSLSNHLTNGSATAVLSHRVPEMPLASSCEAVFGRKAGETSYKMINQPLGTRRPLRVIYLGGGASGINMAYRIKTHLQDIDFVAYEKNAKLGGTWFENKYPGCACDIPSHTYQFTWALNPEWSNYYSGTDEIEGYFNQVVKDHDLGKFFHLEHEVVGARWDESSSHWIIRVRPYGKEEEEFEDWCDFFINGSGLLNAWKWPDIPGLHNFKGNLVHTAKWDRTINTEGQRVALIGVGSSAIQVLPALQPTAKHMFHFIRSKTWISPNFASKYAGEGGSNLAYTEEQKELFRKNPSAQREYARSIELELNKRWRFIIKNSQAQKDIFDSLSAEMKSKLKGRQDLIDVLVPDFAVGCRRLTPGPGFLEALMKPNVTAITSRIVGVTENGIETADGKIHEVDTIICATGFDVSFKPRFPLVGRKGVDLRERWAKHSRAYLSMFVPDFPNYIIVMGPGSPSAHGSLIPSSEQVSEYTVKVLRRMQTEPIKTISVKDEVVDDLFEHAQEQIKTTAWSSSCTSWFKNGKADGTLESLHPGGRLHYFSMLQNPRWEDYNYDYCNNRFAYLGNGFTLREVEERDMTWYWATGDRVSLFEY